MKGGSYTLSLVAAVAASGNCKEIVFQNEQEKTPYPPMLLICCKIHESELADRFLELRYRRVQVVGSHLPSLRSSKHVWFLHPHSLGFIAPSRYPPVSSRTNLRTTRTHSDRTFGNITQCHQPRHSPRCRRLRSRCARARSPRRALPRVRARPWDPAPLRLPPP